MRWIVVGLILCAPHVHMHGFFDQWQQGRSVNTERCFCELTGLVEDCCCDVPTVESLVAKLYPQLDFLLKRKFFKFFKVNLKRPCPFWTDDGACHLRDCSVLPCSEEDIPPGIKAGPPTEDEPSCEREMDLSRVDSTLSDANKEAFQAWHRYDDAEESFCHLDDESSQQMEYVNLELNPERYTGYRGRSARRVWNAIYRENCFRPKSSPSQTLFIPDALLNGLCREKRAFYRLISGLHASINVHLCAHYLKSGFSATWAPNDEEFARRFDPINTNGQGPLWLKNLYFTFLLVLRSVIKAEPYWLQERFYTGDNAEDTLTKERIFQLINTTQSCPSTFDESTMFTGPSAPILKEDIKAHFKNISRIMDCVGCDRCRLWGKIQVQGLGTALKILFSDHRGSRKGQPFLRRTEIVALFNVLGRLASSIKSLELFGKRPRH